MHQDVCVSRWSCNGLEVNSKGLESWDRPQQSPDKECNYQKIKLLEASACLFLEGNTPY